MPDASSEYTDFYLRNSEGAWPLHTLQVNQVSFSKEYRFQPYYREGLWLRDESGQQQYYQWMPLKLDSLSDRANLDFGLSVTLGDLGEFLPDEIQRARDAGTLVTDPAVVRYRIYRSNNLEAPMYGPITLQAKTIARTVQGAQFDAKAPQINATKTGMIYRTDLFPTLLGFL